MIMHKVEEEDIAKILVEEEIIVQAQTTEAVAAVEVEMAVVAVDNIETTATSRSDIDAILPLNFLRNFKEKPKKSS